MSSPHECALCERRWHGGPSEMPVCTQCAEALLRRAFLVLCQDYRDPLLIHDLRRIASDS